MHPASKKAEDEVVVIQEQAIIDDDPADFSDEEQDEEAKAINKQALLEWVTVADFTKEMSLSKIS